MNPSLFPSGSLRHLARVWFLALLIVLGGLVRAQTPTLTLGFTSPANVPAGQTSFTGNLTWTPANATITPTVLSGAAVVPPANVSLDSSPQRITLTRLPNTSGAVQIRLVATVGTNSVSNTFSVVFPVNAAPTLPPISNQNMVGGQTPLTLNLTLADDGDVANLSLTATSSNPSLVQVNAGNTGANGTLQISASSSPFPDSATIQVAVTDGEKTTTRSFTVNVSIPAGAPSLDLSVSPSVLAKGSTTHPFTVRDIVDPDPQDSTFTFTAGLAVPADIAHLHFGDVTNQASVTFTGSKIQIMDFARTVRLTAVCAGGTNSHLNVPIRFSVTDQSNKSGEVVNAITITSVANPLIIGVPQQAVLLTDDRATPYDLFPAGGILEGNRCGSFTYTLSVTAANGLLGQFGASTNFFSSALFPTNSGPSVITSNSGLTMAQVGQALRSLSYLVTPGALPINAQAANPITISVRGTSGQPTVNANLTLHILAVDQPPRIAVPAVQPILLPPIGPLRPFTQVRVSNDDTNAVEFIVELDDPDKGAFTNLGGFSSPTSGVYRTSGSVSNLMASLTNLVFQLNSDHNFSIDNPGGTTFTLTATDAGFQSFTTNLAIQVQNSPRNHLVVRAFNDGLPGSLTHALARAGNNDVITFALPSYPAVIRLPATNATTVLRRNLTLKGPGADLLTLSGDSDGDDVPDRQIFQVRSNVQIEGLTLARGTSAFGGAVQVAPGGILTLRDCAVVHNLATSYGGGIDVDGGQLFLDRCFIGFNRLHESSGFSGAGVSVYSDRFMRFLNTTFAGNVQANASGDGGGGLFVEASDPGTPLDLYLIHCTFADNADVSGRASAVLGITFGTRIRPLNCLFMDGSGRNLEVGNRGEILSAGGNFCDDSTRTSILQQGQSQSTVVQLLNHLRDHPSTDARLGALDPLGHPTPFYPVLAGSPAIGFGSTPSSFGVDQRGVLRPAAPTSGAIEHNAFQRLVLNEIGFDSDVPDFVEIYVPRDSAPVDLAGFSLHVNGVKAHDFSQSVIAQPSATHPAGPLASTVIRPGFGIVVAFTNTVPLTMVSNSNPTPVVRASILNSNDTLSASAVITIERAGQDPLVRTTYLGTYIDPSTSTNILVMTGNSISLAPQFVGHALVPHSLLLPGPFAGIDQNRPTAANRHSPGSDSAGTPFGQDNAEPIAQADYVTVTEDDFTWLPVVDNDFDGDGNDRLVIVDVSTASGPGSGDAASGASSLGGLLAVDPSGSPLRGNRISFDPRGISSFQALPVGGEVLDTFHYEVIDIASAPVEAYSAAGPGATAIRSDSHRLATGASIHLTDASTPAYNGTFTVTKVDDDTFSIPVAPVPSAPAVGRWETAQPRLPTSRDQALVTVKVIGVNDPPVPVNDLVNNVNEHSLVRIMCRPDRAGSTLSFHTDPVPAPTMLGVNLLANDQDVDADDNVNNRRVVGVLPSVNTITNFAGTVGQSPVIVSSATAHGLNNGDVVTLANYGGHPSYNGAHTVTVIDANRFSIPRFYVDNHASKGVWVVLNDTNRGRAVSPAGAVVTLTLRGDAREDHVIYDANASAFLNGLAQGQVHTDPFYVAVSDSHGAIGISRVDVVVTGINDTPVAPADPGGLTVYAPLIGGANTLATVLANGLDLLHTMPPTSGSAARVDLRTLDRSGTVSGSLILPDVWFTDERTPIEIAAADLLANDSDIDRTDVLRVSAVDANSREGAALQLLSSPARVRFNPATSPRHRALARGERVVDTFTVRVTDGMTAGTVTSLVAVLVVGLNDDPIATDDRVQLTEDQTIDFNAITLTPPGNPTLHDDDFDQNGSEPDDRLTMLIVNNLLTPARARVDINASNVHYNAIVSETLNQLADWQTHDDVFPYTITDHSFLFVTDDDYHVPTDTLARRLDVLTNDRDLSPEPGALRIVAVGESMQGGSVSLPASGDHVLYSSPNAFDGDDYFTYTVEDHQGDRRTARVRVRSTVPAFNGILHAAEDRYTVALGETITLDVLANDDRLPASGAVLELAPNLVSSSLPGQPVRSGDQFVYTANSLTPLEFVYEINAGGPSTARARVVVNVSDRRDSLPIRDDAFSVLANSVRNELDVLTNDGLVTSDLSRVRIQALLDAPANGTAVTNASGTAIVYTPNPGFIGLERLRYTATYPVGGTGVVEIAVGRPNGAPDFFTVNANAIAPVELDVLANDRVQPFPVGAMTLRSVTALPGPNVGSLVVNGAGTRLNFTPNSNQGQRDFDYVAFDAGTPARSITNRVTIATVPNGIYANADVFLVRAESREIALDPLVNDISYPNVNKSYSVVAVGTGADAPNAGGLVGIVNNRLVYTPASGFVGNESFTYTLTDSVITDSARVTVRVQRGELFANDDHFGVFHELTTGGDARTFTLPVLLNDRIQPELNQIMSITGVGGGSNIPNQLGTVTIAPDGLSLLYRPVEIPSGNTYTERFTYDISDGTDRRASGVVEVLVSRRVNLVRAIPNPDTFSVLRNSASVQLPVLDNDFVPPGSATGWALGSVSATAHTGTVSIVGRNLRYSPPRDFVGTDRFTYVGNDGLGGAGTATVTVVVGDLPVMADLFPALAGSQLNELDVLANDLLFPSYAGEYRLHSVLPPSAGGSASVSSRDTVLYTPAASRPGGYPYVETLLYRLVDDSQLLTTGAVQVVVQDPLETVDTALITAHVQGVNDIPVISNRVQDIRITDKDSTKPFLGVTITEVDEQLRERIDVRVAIDNASHGRLSHLSGFQDMGNGVYELRGVNAALATARIRQLVFTPTENRLPIPGGEVTTFTITVTDNKSPAVVDRQSSVHVSSVNDAPRILGAVANQEFHYALSITPFSTVVISDEDFLGNQPLTVTVAIQEHTQGRFVNLGSFVSVTTGVFRVSNLRAAEITAQLRAITFVPTPVSLPVGGGITTHFRIEADDGLAPPALDHVTSVIARNSPDAQVRPAAAALQGSFGLEVDAIDDYALIGAPNATTNGTNAGAAFIYRRVPAATNNWEVFRTLRPSAVEANDRFGRAVSLTEETAAVGAIQDEAGSVEVGSVYVFSRHLGGADNWGQVTRITPAGLTAASRFGQSVCLEGDLLAVGAPDATLSPSAPGTGAVFLYRRDAGGPNAWGEVFRWAPTNTAAAAATSLTGWSVSISGDRLVVGSPQFNSTIATPAREGAAFVFARATPTGPWGLNQTIAAADAGNSLEYGWSVSLRGNHLAVGAPAMRAGSVNGAGQVFLLESTGADPFVLKTQLDRRADSERRFGHSVSVKWETVLIGAPHNSGAQNIGAAYLYSRDPASANSWSLLRKLTRPAGSVAGLYGSAVSFKRGTAVVGAPADLNLVANNGYAFLYRFGYNQSPLTVDVIPDQFAERGVPFAQIVPANTFLDPDDDDRLTLGAAFPDGSNGFSLNGDVLSGTPPATGAYRVILTATDRSGRAVSLTYTVFVVDSSSPLSTVRQMWNFSTFGDSARNPAQEAAVWGRNANPDGDAMTNDQEYAFGGNPQVADNQGVVMLPPSGGRVVLQYLRRTNDPGLRYELEFSQNMGAWINVDPLILVETSTPVGPEFERVTVELAAGGSGVVCYRVVVQTQ